MADALPIVVVGAGIAGLTASLALARRGRDVVVIERAGRLEEVGAGIQLSPNASRILLALGLGDGLAEAGVEPEAVVVRSGVDGRTIARLPLGSRIRARYGAPFLVIHRGDLQAVLLEAAAAEPRIALHLGAELLAAEQGGDEAGEAIAVEVRLPSGAERIRAEALVGADGVRSRVRTGLLGGPEAVYSGRTAWRATVPLTERDGDLDLSRCTGLWLGPRAHLVHYPIRSGRALNLVAIVDQPWTDDGFDAPGERRDLDRAFGAWPAAARELLDGPAAWRKWALSAVPSDTPWVRGRIALIGDAAHAMLPFVAQGGAMAIEDAAALARLLADPAAGPAPERLAAFERLRRPRTTSVARAAADNGRIYHLDGLAARARDLGMRVLGPQRLLGRMEWIYGWIDRRG